ncbi:hypothetical protein GOBAR_AA30538 [Gossypium barbadense]|uniref:Uncharacterized protein n=1 Tax=Gossypium barbadense TaxID=3634 RepID=A0A2P5WGG0_GOSBA|nr:hypothetical protein GOBAR_AA30538 [Gossypium barbadense]
MEQINAITIQDEEGLVAPKPKQRQETVETISKNAYEPCSNNNKGPIYKERRLQIEELDEWQTQKLRTPDKSKLSQDKLNTSPNQLKVGDKYFPIWYSRGMRSVNSSHHFDHIEERIFRTTRPGTRACPRLYTYYKMQHGRVKTGQKFFP